MVRCHSGLHNLPEQATVAAQIDGPAGKSPWMLRGHDIDSIDGLIDSKQPIHVKIHDHGGPCASYLKKQ